MHSFRLALLLLLSIPISFYAGPQSVTAAVETNKGSFELTREEKTWLAKHAGIRLGIMDAWPPINFVDEQGNPQGIGVDYVHALNRRLNGILTVVPQPFKEASGR